MKITIVLKSLLVNSSPLGPLRSLVRSSCLTLASTSWDCDRSGLLLRISLDRSLVIIYTGTRLSVLPRLVVLVSVDTAFLGRSLDGSPVYLVVESRVRSRSL